MNSSFKKTITSTKGIFALGCILLCLSPSPHCALQEISETMPAAVKAPNKKIEKLYILIHGFCYAEMTFGKKANALDTTVLDYLERESKCADRWCSQIRQFSETEALVIIPWPGKNDTPIKKFNSFADSALGDRCFILNGPDGFDQDFWEKRDIDFCQAVTNEFKAALVQQKDNWNKEELLTALHALACCRQLNALLAARGYYYDKEKVLAEGWGASFEGCVTKYTLHIRRILELLNPIVVNFSNCVPDAFFLLNAEIENHLFLDNGLGLYLFKTENQMLAYYSMTSQSLEDKPVYVQVALDSVQATVRSKQNIRLWPSSEKYHLPKAPMGCYEPPQNIVKYKNNGLQVPASAGYVYRLAKAPAFIFASPKMSIDDFRRLLEDAKRIN